MLRALKIPLNKREFFTLIGISIIGIIAILAGSMLETIGSREMAKPMTVEITTVDGLALESARVYFKLARSGTLSELTITENGGQKWHYEDVFIENLLISVSSKDIEGIQNVSIDIGDTHMVFSRSEIVNIWLEIDASSIIHFVTDQELNSTRLFVAPDTVRSSTSHLPFSIFKRIINWGGDIEFFVIPIRNSVIPIAIFLFVLATTTIIIKLNNRKLLSKKEDSIKELQNYLQTTYTIISTIVIGLLTATIAAFVYKPDTTLLYKTINETYIKSTIGSFAPESLEQLLVLTLIPLSIPIIFFVHFLWSGILKRISDSTLIKLGALTSALVPAYIFALAYVGLALANFIYLSGSILNHSIGTYVFTLLLFPTLFY
ncbi:hypothetical protein H6788_01720, partial [Candidatus Nomurabacteria bacterium]|nr:hypothetical protein [Candidatus Nomurabacteria bacterium]